MSGTIQVGQAHTGRGGAGNIAPKSPALQPTDLETPTIKQNYYTTGRGGSGNIVSNDDPNNARKAQDVEPSAGALREGSHEASAERNKSYGRGGAANVVKKVKEVVTGGDSAEKKAESK